MVTRSGSIRLRAVSARALYVDRFPGDPGHVEAGCLRASLVQRAMFDCVVGMNLVALGDQFR